jgi:hypothetical protein
MRLPIIAPAELSAEQKPLYDNMRDGIARNFQGFVNIRDDGACWVRGIRGSTSPNLASRFGS